MYHLLFTNVDSTTPTPSPECHEGDLSLFQISANSNDNMLSFTNIVLYCLNGRFTLICGDATVDPSIAGLLCYEYSYSGE